MASSGRKVIENTEKTNRTIEAVMYNKWNNLQICCADPVVRTTQGEIVKIVKYPVFWFVMRIQGVARC